MTFAVLYLVSSADECAVKSIFQNLQSAAKEGSPFSQETLRLVQGRGAGSSLPGAHLPGGTQPGDWKDGISPKSSWSKGDPFSKKYNCAPSLSKDTNTC